MILHYGRHVHGNTAEDSWPDQLTLATFDELEQIAREVAGAHAHIIVGRLPNDAPYIEITPLRAGARSANLVADQWIRLAVESAGGGLWELNYDRSAIAFVRSALEALAAGQITERVAFGRSMLTLTFEDGTVHTETGHRGCLATLTPLPGWRRWGEVRGAVPYS